MIWLDYYAAGAADKLRAAGLPVKDDVEALAIMSMQAVIALARQKGVGTEAEAAFFSCVHAMTSWALPVQSRESAWEAIAEMSGEDHAEFFRRLHTPRALRPSPELVASLAGANAPPAPDWWAPLIQGTWYLDIPHRAMTIGEGAEVRAIFTQPTMKGGIAVACVLTEPGRNAMKGRLAWIMEQDAGVPVVHGHPIEGVDPGHVRERIGHFIVLLMLYKQVAAKAESVPVPCIDRKAAAGMKPKKLRAKLKKASFFSVRDLRPPRDNFGRPRTGGGGWKLDHAVEVRGHFRWQAHGPKMSQRKLIWIEPHMRGPKEREKRPVIEYLGDRH
ncbi:MAG: hypothetical protein D6819_05495 [Gammaproteobacteria bacterium]|nr:MAG: hypothetical protein D6819_05495 [Gammaproteobacteria bacterium]